MREEHYVGVAFWTSCVCATVHTTGAFFILNFIVSVVLIRAAFYANEIMQPDNTPDTGGKP